MSKSVYPKRSRSVPSCLRRYQAGILVSSPSAGPSRSITLSGFMAAHRFYVESRKLKKADAERAELLGREVTESATALTVRNLLLKKAGAGNMLILAVHGLAVHIWLILAVHGPILHKAKKCLTKSIQAPYYRVKKGLIHSI